MGVAVIPRMTAFAYRLHHLAICGAALGALACDGRVPGPGDLVLNEAMSNNEGAAVDELGELEDWVELLNRGPSPVELGHYTIADSAGKPFALPRMLLGPGQRVVLWADDTPAQGRLHLPFKFASGGDEIELSHVEAGVVDRLDLPALGENESFARFADGVGEFAICRYATPGRNNGTTCDPPVPPNPGDSVGYSSYQWPSAWPSVNGPLSLTELALRPARFVEVANISTQPVDLSDYKLTLSTHRPGVLLPTLNSGIALEWGQATLAPGERVQIAVDPDDVAAIAANAEFEGVASLFEIASASAVDRVEFMHWPEGASLARSVDDRGQPRFCAEATPGAPNTECNPIAHRDVGTRLHHLRTPSDFAALANGGTTVGIESVKFVIDTLSGYVVHFLSSAEYALHYTFIREQIQGLPRLDRCDPTEAALFYDGWVEFSQQEYFRVLGRRYLLGTLNRHLGQGLQTVDFAEGDAITAELMKQAFFVVTSHLHDAQDWALHPSNTDQAVRLRLVDGEVPIVGENAPFRDITLQALAPGTAYGELRFVPAAELAASRLGPDVIVVTDDVPNDIPFVGGLITEAFQTPLAHVNILSRSRNTPNMALSNAREDARIREHLGELVRFEVTQSGFTLEPTTLGEAQAFWEQHRPVGPRRAPRSDLSVRELQSLADHNFNSTPAIGAKAAQLAELQQMYRQDLGPHVTLPMPQNAFAVPLVHSVEHFEQSGARALYDSSSAALSDPTTRGEALQAIRDAIMSHPISSELLNALHDRIDRDFGRERVRFRSSSNAEDLADFNGAGLYTSISAEIGDRERPIAVALHTVWASLWNARAFDEREYANLDHNQTAMGVLVHNAFLSERVNGVAVSRDIFDPIRSDQYTINSQFGEASVTNPAPGVSSDLITVRWTWPGRPITRLSASSFLQGPVMSKSEIDLLVARLQQIHNHFRPLIDPNEENRWFAMDIEFKLLGDERRLMIKQARPYSFGHTAVPDDCREF